MVVFPLSRNKNRDKTLNLARSALLVCAIVLFLLPACDDFTFYGEIDDPKGDPEQPLEISPVSATVPVGANLIFSCRGGFPPYSYTLLSGSGEIDADSGVYTAPDIPTVVIIRVTDSDGTHVDAQIVVVE